MKLLKELGGFFPITAGGQDDTFKLPEAEAVPGSAAAENPALLRTRDVGSCWRQLCLAPPGPPSLLLFLGAARTSSFSPSTTSESLPSLLRGRRQHPALYQLCLSLILQAETDGDRELLHPCLAGFSYITLLQILILTRLGSD